MNTKRPTSTVRIVRNSASPISGFTEYHRDDEPAVTSISEAWDPYPDGAPFSAPERGPARMIMLGSALLMLAAVFALVAWLLGTGADTTRANTVGLDVAPRVGALAPDFELVDVRTNQNVRLSSLRGKPVFVNFWGTWCPPCRQEMPEMQKVYNKYQGQAAMLGVSMGPRDTLEAVKSFVDSYKYTWTFLQDNDFAVATAYQAYSIPTSYFIDKDGVIRAVHIGAMDEAVMEGYMQKAR